jgi:nitrite reductase/ring-hydroxylating ferredoxin subunit
MTMTRQTQEEASTQSLPAASRRAMLAGVGAVAIAVLGGCTTNDQNAPAGGASPGGTAGAGVDDGGAHDGGAHDGGADDNVGGGDTPTAGTSTGAAGASQRLASTADIPVGGGVVFGQRRVVVTQPQKGTFKAFSAACTHAGCLVTEVKNGTISCRCHGSEFKVADGSVATGPATSSLKSVKIAVDGTDIRLA